MKIVLRSCFARKYENPSDSDESLVHCALLAVIRPILRPPDVSIFNEIVGDLFPSVELVESSNDWLREAFLSSCSDKKLQPIDCLYKKLVETHVTMGTRHALMLIGKPFTGKSTVLRLLAKALSVSNKCPGVELGIGDFEELWYLYRRKFYRRFSIFAEYINAKSVTSLQLFGVYDSISMDWTDGLVSHAFRKFFDLQTNNCHKWIVFDGPVDSEWIENLNTVLDDDRKLCLSSGEAITLTANTSVIFEVDSMSQASPATVSTFNFF